MSELYYGLRCYRPDRGQHETEIRAAPRLDSLLEWFGEMAPDLTALVVGEWERIGDAQHLWHRMSENYAYIAGLIARANTGCVRIAVIEALPHYMILLRVAATEDDDERLRIPSCRWIGEP